MEGPFLSDNRETAVPPWAMLRTLEEASRNFENDETGRSERWIAKFSSKNDENDTGAWEKVVHDLARMCGLHVPDSKVEKFSKLGSTFPMELTRKEI